MQNLLDSLNGTSSEASRVGKDEETARLACREVTKAAWWERRATGPAETGARVSQMATLPKWVQKPPTARMLELLPTYATSTPRLLIACADMSACQEPPLCMTWSRLKRTEPVALPRAPLMTHTICIVATLSL